MIAAIEQEVEERFAASLHLIDQVTQIANLLSVQREQLQRLILREPSVDLILENLGHHDHLLVLESLRIIVIVSS